MPPPPKPTLPSLPQPRHSDHFDPWNSSATGHQRPEIRSAQGTAWRDDRNRKLMSQFWPPRDDGKGPPSYKNSSSVQPGSPKLSVKEMLAKPGSMMMKGGTRNEPSAKELTEMLTTEKKTSLRRKDEDEARESERRHGRGMFAGTVVYVNGSTAPLVSDHKLKRMVVENGGRISLHLGRRQVTHVVIGRPVGGAGGAGCGGGLASGKLEKEIKTVRGCGVKFVGVEWILESINAGKRLPETRFANLKIAREGQRSVFGKDAKGSPSQSRATSNDGP